MQIIVFPTFLACICRCGQTTIFAKSKFAQYLKMLMVCTRGKFESNLNQTFPFTTHLHINSYETNIHVLPPRANKIQICSPKFTTHLLNSQTWVKTVFSSSIYSTDNIRTRSEHVMNKKCTHLVKCSSVIRSTFLLFPTWSLNCGFLGQQMVLWSLQVLGPAQTE